MNCSLTNYEARSPSVTVVMGVFGNVESFGATLSSVLDQTLRDLEVVVVDDGNPEKSKKILRVAAKKDVRVKLIERRDNLGLTQSLIEGCENAEGRYIARIDNGDLMVPSTRLEIQKSILDADKKLVVVGGEYEVVDCVNRFIFRGNNKEKNDHELRKTPKGKPVFRHVSVMMRKSAYEAAGGYKASHVTGQDTELWPRLLNHGKGYKKEDVFAITPMLCTSISVARNNEQIMNEIARLLRSKHHSVTPLTKKCVMIFLYVLKMMLPLRLRIFLRYLRSMDLVGRIPKRDCTSLEGIRDFYAKKAMYGL